MSSRPELKLDWCSYKAAKYAVEHWHYSRVMPAGKTNSLGVWEGGAFIGTIIFGSGCCPQIADPFGLSRQQAAELVRVALKEHIAPVSKILAVAIKMIRSHNPKLKILVSYADPEQGHYGIIYQASNWIYCGETQPVEWFVNTATGKRIHSKTLRTGRRGYATRMKAEGRITSIKLIKRKYLLPISEDIRERIELLRQPYPKRAGSIETDAPVHQRDQGGVTPTPALQPV